MAAPSGTKWGDIKGSYGRIGIYVGLSSTATTTTATIEVWFWSKYSVSDSNNRFWYNHDATTATTEKAGDITIRHTVSSGSGWSTSNQTKLATYTKAYTRTTAAQTKNCAAKFSGIDSVASGSTMTVTASFTIPALPKYTISYKANGGSGAPSSQTKTHGTAIKLSTTKPTRTGYSFLGWSTSSTATSATYAAGASYTANTSATLYAVWKANTFTVSFNANGGEGAPGTQTKTYGVTLTLSDVIPTLTNYNFLGWDISSNATTAIYQPGGSYTANSGATLYAVWELAYTPPRIASISSSRCESDGTSSDEGTYFKIAFSWATDKEISSHIEIKWQSTTDDSGDAYYVPTTGTEGEVSCVLGSGNISTENTYNVSVIVTDEMGSSTVSRSIPSLTYAIDFLKGGKGVSIGKPAKKQNAFEVGFTQYDKFGTLAGNGLVAYTGAAENGIDPDTTLEPLILTDLNTPGTTFMYISTVFYSTKSETANRLQIGIPYSHLGDIYRRYYYDGVWSAWANAALQSYPVNSIYISYSHTSPAELFGGTWTRLSPYFLYGTGSTGVIGETGGEASHTLTIAEMPKHSHNSQKWSTSGTTKAWIPKLENADTPTAYSLPTSTTGGGAAHNNIPPYIKVSIWRRTA